MFASPVKPSTPAKFHRLSSSSSCNLAKLKKLPISIRCRAKKVEGLSSDNYYELLGVSANSTVQEIKEAYRKLQKKHHPDIAGSEGHEYTLLLNEAYHTLMSSKLRSKYDEVMANNFKHFARKRSGLQSSWNGPVRPQALFVDENKCVGCQECVCHAGNTFVMNEAIGSARVKVQFGDDEQRIQVAVDSCPVDCIHWVDSEELPLLEYVIRPQPKEGYGVFGGGWERPADVFRAAKKLKKQLQRETESNSSKPRGTEVETASQAKARHHATMMLQLEELRKLFGILRELFVREKDADN